MHIDRPARLKSFSYIGLHRYHVRIGTWDRQPHFSATRTVTLAVAHLLHTAGNHQFAVHAYCFMPDHVHVLTSGTCFDSKLPPFIARWKQATAYAFSNRGKGSRLWQPGFFERVLREDEPDQIVARYIVGNPVRAGLVTSIALYPYTWSRWPID